MTRRDAMFLFSGFVLAVAFSSMSQTYIGASFGRSHAELPGSSEEGCDRCISSEIHTRQNVYSVAAGYRHSWFAGEVGASNLSGYHAHNVGPLPNGVMRDIHQEIDTKQRFFRGLAFGPSIYGIEPYASLGVTRVTMKNHEWGFNDPTRKFVEQVNYDTRTRPFYGLGLQADLNDHVAMRAEVTHVRHVAVSHWTLEQNVTAGWLGLVVKL